MWFEPESLLLTSGHGTGTSKLAAFDSALFAAGIANFNLIRVSSIVPPGLPVHRLLRPSLALGGQGLLAPTVFGWTASSEPHETISATVGVGLPTRNARSVGVAFYNAFRGSNDDCEKSVRDMILERLAARNEQGSQIELVSASVQVGTPWRAVVAAAMLCDREIAETFPPETRVSIHIAPDPNGDH